MADLKGVLAPKGFRAGAAACGLKSTGAPDIGLIVSDTPAAWAGAFTTNRVQAAPVKLCRKRLARPTLRAVVVNAGNANACTGLAGRRDAERMATLAAAVVGARANEVAVASTGVIGRKLDMEKVRSGVEAAGRNLGRSARHARDIQRAILTTDLAAKEAHASFRSHGKAVTVGGICKGSGMIAPRMATMLGFVATDAGISSKALRAMLPGVVEETFNAVTVDGDTSTNDSVFVLANGASGTKLASAKEIAKFRGALTEVCGSLAKQIAADGEGATKLVTITVLGARNVSEARCVARTIAESPLVKTALHGADPNWGRIVCAAGYSGVAVRPERMTLDVQGIRLFERGEPARFDAARASRLMRAKEVELRLELGMGRASAVMWTCDLSKEYITINADYHT